MIKEEMALRCALWAIEKEMKHSDFPVFILDLHKSVMDEANACMTFAEAKEIISSMIENANFVKHGYWKRVKGTYDSYTCSCCGAKQGRLTYTNHEYCGACGAKMDGGVDNETD